MENKTKLYLNYLRKEEKESITEYLSFVRDNNEESKKRLIEICSHIYAKEKELERKIIDGKTAQGSYVGGGYVILEFEREDLTEEAIRRLGSCSVWDWRYFYGISVGKDDRELYVISYSNACCPNWNDIYDLHISIPLKDLDFAILKKDSYIYRIDNALHSAINDAIYSKKRTFYEENSIIYMTIKDQHGNYSTIQNGSKDELFRDYADNYTGYRNYRRQSASEWCIVNEEARREYEEWKKTAKGLKSDFDKFYGGGIVD